MNRGRKRGGVSSGFASLRDGVKRRLFDPHTVPVSPDPRTVISRLIPLTCCAVEVVSNLPIPEPMVSNLTETKPNQIFQKQLFETSALASFIFENSSDYQRLTVRSQGLSAGRIAQPVSGQKRRHTESSPVNSLATTSHLLLQKRHIEIWRDGTLLSCLSNPLEWYPDELIERIKPKSTRSSRAKNLRSFSGVTNHRQTAEDLDTLISDKIITEAADDGVLNEEMPMEGAVEADEGDNDSEDARWNGEQVGDDEGDDELENDYCENYFDNGEGDIDDMNGLHEDQDEGGGGDYYD